jgi:YQGE family putative transporter
LVQYLAIVPAFFAGGYLARRFGQVLSLRLGFFFNALVFFTALTLREGSVSHPVLLGSLAGLGIGFYYLGFHSLTMDLTRSSERDHFLSYALFLASITRILAPALAGWTISAFRPQEGREDSLLGYYLVFAVALFLYSWLVYWSFELRAGRPAGPFEPMKVAAFRNNRDWDRMTWVQFLLGVRNGVFWFVVAILVYRASRHEGVVGNFSMVGNLVAVATTYTLVRWAHEGNRRWGLWTSSLVTCVAVLFLGYGITYWTLGAFVLLNAVGVSWLQVVFNAVYFEVVEGAREGKRRKLEYLALRELPLTAGRIIGLGFFLGAHSYFGEAGLRAAIVALGCSHMGIFLFLPKSKAV